MIYTVTMNPAIDYVIDIADFEKGKINSYKPGVYMPGGKGINVSMVLASLGSVTTAVGICSGFTGKEIVGSLEKSGVKTKFIQSEKGSSRINIKLCSNDGMETDFNGTGPEADAESIGKMTALLKEAGKGDYIVLAGSTPPGTSDMIYADICRAVSEGGARVVVDSSGSTLINTLKWSPFLIKPNQDELGGIFDTEIDSLEKAAYFGNRLRSMGAKNVLVSMGSAGAALITENGESLFMEAAKGEKVSTVGAGDSMVAGFIYGLEATGDVKEALRWGTAAGSATAFSRGIAKAPKIREIYRILT